MARKRVRLHTIGHVLSELGRQYRRADNGDLGWQDAAAASRILREIRCTLEASDVENRLAALEAALVERGLMPAQGTPARHATQVNGNGPGHHASP